MEKVLSLSNMEFRRIYIVGFVNQLPEFTSVCFDGVSNVSYVFAVLLA